MKKALILSIAVIMLIAMTTVASAEDNTVFITVSVDGELIIAAQPVSPTEMTVDGVLKAAHAAFFPGGESGYEAGIDPMWNMFLISKAWGVNTTPFVILNGAPLGAPENPGTADTTAVKGGDNIIMSLSSDPMVPARAVALKVSVSGNSATVTATEWILDFTTFTYSSTPLANAQVTDPETGEVLGTTDAEGNITVPATGVVAVEGLAAIPVDGSAGSGTEDPAAAPVAQPEEALPIFEGDTLLQIMTFGGLAVFIPIIFAIVFIGKKQEAIHWQKSRKI